MEQHPKFEGVFMTLSNKEKKHMKNCFKEL